MEHDAVNTLREIVQSMLGKRGEPEVVYALGVEARKEILLLKSSNRHAYSKRPEQEKQTQECRKRVEKATEELQILRHKRQRTYMLAEEKEKWTGRVFELDEVDESFDKIEDHAEKMAIMEGWKEERRRLAAIIDELIPEEQQLTEKLETLRGEQLPALPNLLEKIAPLIEASADSFQSIRNQETAVD